MNHAIHFTLTLAISPELTALLNRLLDEPGGMTAAETDAVTTNLQEKAARIEGITGDTPPATP